MWQGLLFGDIGVALFLAAALFVDVGASLTAAGAALIFDMQICGQKNAVAGLVSRWIPVFFLSSHHFCLASLRNICILGRKRLLA